MTDTSIETSAEAASEFDVPAPEVPVRPMGRARLASVGALVAAAAQLMLFVTLAGVYMSLRDSTPRAEWPPPDLDIPNIAALTLTIGLLMSLVTALWIHQAARTGSRQHVLMAIGLTLVLAVAHINGLAFVWSVIGLPVASSDYSLIVYSLTGAHLAFVIGGCVALVALAVRAVGGQLEGRAGEPATAFSIYWAGTVLAWAVVYTFVFLVK